jgi:hypothetical protein
LFRQGMRIQAFPAIAITITITTSAIDIFLS